MAKTTKKTTAKTKKSTKTALKEKKSASDSLSKKNEKSAVSKKSKKSVKTAIPILETASISESSDTKELTNSETSNQLLKKVADSSIEEKPKASSETTEETKRKRGKRGKKKSKTWEEKAQKLPTFEVSNFPKYPIKSILITQAKPTDLQNPYQLLIDKYKVKIDFRPFIKVEGLSGQEFRNQKVDVLEYSNIIFTSRLAIDHFFRILNEMRVNLPDTTKFFCLNEQIAYYMQKYMELRKRRIFWGQGTLDDLKTVLKRFIEGKFLLPASDTIKEKVIGILDALNAQYTAVDVYKTVPEKITDIKPENYDAIVFFTPIAAESLKKNFPNFKQNKTRFAAYSIITANRLKELGYRVDIYAPTIEFPSMVNAIAHYLLHIDKK
ncbi:MAG TPA: uroporphyrinogen-III synthase [Bacteroidia bacterium]|nr:uroporphyrinogen-III synthase [Bacteroidia bacterium]